MRDVKDVGTVNSWLDGGSGTGINDNTNHHHSNTNKHNSNTNQKQTLKNN